MAPNNGAKNKDSPKKMLTTTAVSPVRPPSLMPAADSTYTKKEGKRKEKGEGGTREIRDRVVMG